MVLSKRLNPDLSVNLRHVLRAEADSQMFPSVLYFSLIKFPLLWLIQCSSPSPHWSHSVHRESDRPMWFLLSLERQQDQF